MTPALKLVRHVGMFSTCKDIEAFAGDENFAGAHFDAWSRIWYVSVHNRDDTVTEYDLHGVTADDDCIERVEAILRLAYRSNYYPTQREENV